MATRGAIARLTHALPPKFAGRYHHWDSYPSGLGRTLWSLYHGHFAQDLNRMLQVLLDEHPAGWSSLNAADFDQAPGFIEEPDPSAEEPNCQPQCYCHGDRHEAAWPVTDENASASGCEWAYVFTSAHSVDSSGQTQHHDTLLILSSYTPAGDKMIGFFGQGDPQAHWQVVTVVDLKGTEPDWDAVEKINPTPEATVTSGTVAVRSDNGIRGVLIHRDYKTRGAYVVRLPHAEPHHVRRFLEPDGIVTLSCTCREEENFETEPGCVHGQAVVALLARQREVAKARQQRGLGYSGSRVCLHDETAPVSQDHSRTQVMVLAWEDGLPRPLDPAPSQRLHNHSPAGFEWSYGGSGPAQLALAVLFDFTGDEELSLTHYQAFKHSIIAALPRHEEWRIRGDDIERFLASCQSA